MRTLLNALSALSLMLAPVAAALALATPADAQARRHWQRGDTLPEAVLRGGPNVDFTAQRLRRPPAGYGWFALDGDLILASLSTGLVLEVVEG